MRKVALLIGLALVLAGGCAGKPAPAKQAADALHELGRPWPVLVGEFDEPPRIVRHDAGSLEFTAGSVRYLLSYGSRRLSRLRPGFPEKPTDARWGRARWENGEGRRLTLVDPDGRPTPASEAVIPAAGEGYAQTGDLAGLAFYEKTPRGAQLVYLDQATGNRAVWRSMTMVPPGAVLLWSPGERYLLEEAGGRLIAYERTQGAVAGQVEGTAPVFSPAGRHLLYRRPDGRLGLLDLRTGLARAVPRMEDGYQALAEPIWTPDETRLLYQAEAAPGSPGGRSPYLLYAFQPADGAVLRFPLAAPLDLPRYAPFLQAGPNQIPRLLALVPQLARASLAALTPTAYLVGEGKRVSLLDTAARFTPLYEFRERISAMSLGGKDRLTVVTRGEVYRLYAWRLPEYSLLGRDRFPARFDLCLGDLRLGARRDEIEQLLGRPLAVEERTDPLGGKDTHTTLRFLDRSLTFSRDRLIKIICTGTAAPTGRGVKVGDSHSAIHDRYGKPTYEHADYLSYQGSLDGKAVKVAFTLDGKRRVAAVLLSFTTAKP